MTNPWASAKIKALQDNCEKVIKGKSAAIRATIIGILAQGHVLIEDIPGVGKTTLARLLARSIDCSFQRIQFTSDLLPSDILGVSIYNHENQSFEFKPGPIFASIVLADEINRTTPKTQSALLEAMSQAQVSIDGQTRPLPKPFVVIGTQNPIEYHGAFPLPRAQLDRFLVRVHMGYPSPDDERAVLREQVEMGNIDHITPVLTGPEALELQRMVREIRVNEDIIAYIQAIVQKTRETPQIELGVSTRAALALRNCAQARALAEGRDFCVPDDVKKVCVPVLAHRIQVARSFERETFAAHREDEEMIETLVNDVPSPI